MRIRRKKLSKDLTLYFNNNYPKCINNKDNKIFTVILGIGGNIGDMFSRFDSLLKAIKNDTRINMLNTSPILKNPPFGYTEQEYFYNAILKISTNMTPLYLLNSIHKYEKRFGRKRTFKDAPRTMDIDIIFIQKNGKNIYFAHKDLKVPHIGWKVRDSVLIPLQYIDNNKI
ncbi:MAG: 2-amino-4-hydroxy-6-hydroxymethyldihydropteridine diphosphokinase [Arcobacteraceae bacterium]